MRKTTAILSFTLLASFAIAQKPFKTIVPQKSIVVGEAFQVQYVIDDGEAATNFITPVFREFNTVAGPNIYLGNSNHSNNYTQSKNFVFTLVALSPGKLIIPGTFISLNGKQVRSNDNFIEVISKETAMRRFQKEMMANSEYYLRPGEDVQQKIRQNLFMKVQVNKKICFVGEPVVATFKLYSRLESKSDIVKNPGFYGFSVLDMVNLSDRFVTTENINGKLFDVHTIRKVQLYPLQAGVFTIDAMEVENKVEFSRSVVKKKTEQEIIEGVLSNEPEETAADAEVFENDISTEPITVVVKPIPQKGKPAVFSGAIGDFSISSAIINEGLTVNEEGVLEITIAGKGNFIQLDAPVINWPAGIEGFEPVVKDSLDIYATPLKGKRKFRYAFVASAQGTYAIPSVSLTFFNADTGIYKTVTTRSQQINIGEKKEQIISVTANRETRSNREYGLMAMILLTVVCGGLFFWAIKKRKSDKPGQKTPVMEKSKSSAIDEWLQPAQPQATDKDFYTILHQSVWNFFSTYYKLSGTELNKGNLFARMKESGLPQSLIDETAVVLQQCETGMFTNVTISEDRQLFFGNTKRLLDKIEKELL